MAVKRTISASLKRSFLFQGAMAILGAIVTLIVLVFIYSPTGAFASYLVKIGLCIY